MNRNYITLPLFGVLFSNLWSNDLERYPNPADAPIQLVAEVSGNEIIPAFGNIMTYPDSFVMPSVEQVILESFVLEIVDNAQSMPSDIANFVNDNFWDLI